MQWRDQMKFVIIWFATFVFPGLVGHRLAKPKNRIVTDGKFLK